MKPSKPPKSPSPRLRHYRGMTSACFVCNLPILSHQVGLEWTGGNGWDELTRSAAEESTLRQRLGSRRESAAQAWNRTHPEEDRADKKGTRRRRSSLAHLSDMIRDWSSGGTRKRSKSALDRRETLADLDRSVPRSRNDNTCKCRRRQSSAESGLKAFLTKRRGSKPATPSTESRYDWILTTWNRWQNNNTEKEKDKDKEKGKDKDKEKGKDKTKEKGKEKDKDKGKEKSKEKGKDKLKDKGKEKVKAEEKDKAKKNKKRRESPEEKEPRRDSIDDKLQRLRRASIAAAQQRTRPHSPYRAKSFADAASEATAPCPAPAPAPTVTIIMAPNRKEAECKPSSSGMPTIITSAVTPSPTSPTEPQTQTPTVAQGPTKETGAIRKTTNASGRRDSTTQCGKSRRNSRAGISPERRMIRLQRQATAYDESAGPSGARRRDSGGSTLGPDEVRRDSLSPDSAARPRQDRAGPELSPAAARRKGRMRRQGSSARGRRPRSPDSSSCSSREPSPCARPERPVIRRQSTTEEILIARGFRRQSTTEEMIRCRNFRRQSCQSDDACMRSKGRRDSSTQIVDGTPGTMTVETTSTFFDTSTQTDPSPQYDNNHYHEECLRCNSCGMNLTGPNQNRARRYKNQILCDLHFADVTLMETNDFMQQLRSFKAHSLGCAVARRKSSTTVIFPLPPQACSDEFCEEHPHFLVVTPGYWIECSRQKITTDTIWDESESEHEDGPGAGINTDRNFFDGTLDEADEGNEAAATSSQRKKTPIEEQWERAGAFELTSVEQETYEKYFYNKEHWNYFSTDEDLGPVIMSIKQETVNARDQFRILIRAISYTVHGLIPACCVFADRYNREDVVKSLGKEININPPLVLGQLPDTPEELLKLDQVFIKSELKVGVMYVSEGQVTEEQILDNNENTPLFDEFLELLGDRIRLKGFDKYKGGLDAANDLTGLFSVYTNWRGIEVMFHISTLLPYEKHDPQKLQRKRHIGNDIVCIVFLEADNTSFSPACIKSHFLHTFIIVRVSAKIKRRPTRYEISVVARDEVGAYKPYLWEQSVFDRGPMFREWLLTKIVNGERASYSAPKFARMQERTRSQMLEDMVANLLNHAETGQIPKPYRRGSWRPIGHMRPSSPLLDSVRDQFEDHDALSRDFSKVFTNNEENMTKNGHLFDVTFLVGQSKEKKKIKGVRAILGVRSRVFQEMLYGIQTGFGSPQVPVADLLSRPAPSLVSETPSRRLKSSNFLQVPDMEAPRPKSVPNSPMVKRAFSRLGTITAGWGRSIRKQHSNLNSDDRKKWASSQDCSGKIKEVKEKHKDKNKAGASGVPRLSVCADQQKVDKVKLEQTEFIIIEFEVDTFGILLDYLHTGCCQLSCITIPGLICAAEHFDLPELLQACFHHAKQFLRTEVVCTMLITLENYYWRYTSASELVNMILAFVEQRAYALFQTANFLELSESMVQMIMCRNLEVPEVRKFEAMLRWARYKVEFKTPAHLDSDREFKCIMDRLTKDLKLHRISPQELIKVVLPTKAIRNDKILETLTHQANTGVYRINQNHIQAVQKEEATATTSSSCTRPAEMESIDLGI